MDGLFIDCGGANIVGVVAFSLGLTHREPSPCNRALAAEVRRIVLEQKSLGKTVVVVAQWEIAAGLALDMVACSVRKHHNPDLYLDSNEVMAQAAKVFREREVQEVIPVANPFLHLWKCRKLVRQLGFTLVSKKIGWTGFCPQSIQWWDRGPLQLLLYSVLQKLSGRRGK